MVSKVVELFLLSKLDVETLAKIWDICDIKQKGYLDKNSFILALYLIDQRLKGIKIC
ncbi:hypothetical protein K502DRAFT_323994 [Neoconidiobolus thromboides FSU 785]|nr:hypothetical protein K502DRAFT_323994 [Neoconidiobolus thromboides FSU 785]